MSAGRRLSLPGELEGDAAPSSTPSAEATTQQPPPLNRSMTATEPPGYSKYAPGSRAEFVRDLSAYQAACIIHKTVDLSIEDLPIPSYDESENPPSAPVQSAANSEFFRLRFLEVLSKLNEFMNSSRQKNSDRFKLGASILILSILVGGGVAWIIAVGSTLIVAFIIIVGIVIFGHIIYSTYRLYQKRRFIKALALALEKVDKFEKLDDRTEADVKNGVLFIVHRSHWPDAKKMARDRPPRYELTPVPRPEADEQAARAV